MLKRGSDEVREDMANSVPIGTSEKLIFLPPGVHFPSCIPITTGHYSNHVRQKAPGKL